MDETTKDILIEAGMKKVIILTLVGLFLSAPISFAKRNHTKEWYRDRWCAKNYGESAVTGSRVYDCLTEEYVFEFDYADHWYEAIGESLYYAMQTGKKPAVVLIIEHENDLKYWNRLNRTIRHYDLPIKTFKTSTGVRE